MGKREDFEAWYKKENCGFDDFSRCERGDYEDFDVRRDWDVWQAALAAQAQKSQWMPVETAPTGREFLLAFYYRHRPHDVLRRVVTFVDKDVIALGWCEIPPAPEGE